MASTSRRNAPLPASLDWVNWLQAGITMLMVVLFVVMISKTRQQSTNIRVLQERVQGLENSRALDRSAGMEEQLRSTVGRLQELERSAARVDALSAENSSLQQQLRELRAATRSAPRDTGIPPLPPIRTEDAIP
ncbi:MAG: hypothetical protein VKK98_06830 [Cyanobacteriota bacterium]|nr:hypothetical protein [Cyanobacteriota bacterium]